ncbi:uncharacterized protein LOC121875778 isoform X2 [Homarus americanus]|uniref:uncharacterized protein LOC121875778 isoform X2 n=1 Tax=Homarus americanus TaxID=6706 RepID=UPI001C436D29|nr:uncharacterized protein LOC121875778 isoform X2 [Homarus americanus]
MVSVVGSLLSHTLWRVVGGDPHHPGGRQLAASHTTFPRSCDNNVSSHTEGKTSRCVSDGGCDTQYGHGAIEDNQSREYRRVSPDSHVETSDFSNGWVVLDTPSSSALISPKLPSSFSKSASWSAKTCTVSFPVGSSSEAPPIALDWWESCLAPLNSNPIPGRTCVEPPLASICASTCQGSTYPGQVQHYTSLEAPSEPNHPETNQLMTFPKLGDELTKPVVGKLRTSLQVDQELTSRDKLELSCQQIGQKFSSHQLNQMINTNLVQDEVSSNIEEINSPDIHGVVCPDLPRRVPGRSRRSLKRSKEIATLGSSDSSTGRWRWQRQCVRRSRSEDTSSVLLHRGVVSHAEDTMNSSTLSNSPDVIATAPPLTPDDSPESLVDCVSASSEGGRLRHSVGCREDIRDFDIYKITQPVGQGQYSRLPSLATQSDSDTDEGAGVHEGLRKRKRRNPEARDAGERKRYREEEDEEDAMMALEATTLLLPSPLQLQERLNATATKPTDTVPRSSSSSSRSGNTPLPSPITTTITPSTSPGKDKEEEDLVSDDTMSDEDDDDEASTVVPEDFGNETDSDIEVLIQSESWVDLSNQPGSPDRVTPLPFGNGEEYLRLLREAQRESNQSSARVSLASSRRDTPRDSPHDSPKSPPNSPNTEMATDPEEAVLKGVYINYYNKEGDFIRVEKNTETDWIWDWSSRPDQTPPKEWRFSHPRKGVSRGASIRHVMVGNSSLFSRDVLYTLLITNVLSLLLGTGIGIWLSKRSGGDVTTLPIN